MRTQQRRLAFIFMAVGLFIAGVSLILISLGDNLLYFVSPSQLLQASYKQQQLRLGGVVRLGSVVRQNLSIQFVITDGQTEILVRYKGLTPELFREGQGVVVEGRMVDNVFIAQTLLAKHDERYMPREVVHILKKQGQWRS